MLRFLLRANLFMVERLVYTLVGAASCAPFAVIDITEVFGTREFNRQSGFAVA
ncbi:MAG: hypothetical protein AAGE59_10620 [Cyanobacteria bacterium P01_F01_bin.86]